MCCLSFTTNEAGISQCPPETYPSLSAVSMVMLWGPPGRARSSCPLSNHHHPDTKVCSFQVGRHQVGVEKSTQGKGKELFNEALSRLCCFVFRVCLNVWLFALQRDALACAMAMADALWTWTAGTVSASWAGEELAVTLPWRRHAAMGKTTMEVGHEHMWYVRLHRAYKPLTVNSHLGLILQGRLFFDSWWEQTAKSARLTQPEWIGIQIKWVWIWGARAAEGHLFVFKSSL